jgi:dihydroorotate dehydrogenase
MDGPWQIGYTTAAEYGRAAADAARAMRAAGADLVQVYTGLIYRGPGLVRDCIAALGR